MFDDIPDEELLNIGLSHDKILPATMRLSKEKMNGHDPTDFGWRAKVEHYADNLITKTLDIGETTVDYDKVLESWGDTSSSAETSRGRYFANRKKPINYEIHTCSVDISNLPAPEKIDINKCNQIFFHTTPGVGDLLFREAKYVPVPVYQYTFKHRPARKYSYIIDQKQEPIMDASVEQIVWLISFAIRANYQELMMKLGVASRATPITAIRPAYWKTRLDEDPDTSSSYKEASPKFVSELLCKTYYNAFVSACTLLTEYDASVHAKRAQQVADGDSILPSDMSLRTAKFAAHPEVVRYFGGTAFVHLSQYYHEKWLMGLRLKDLYNLYYTLVNDTYKLVTLKQNDKYISFSHIYSFMFSSFGEQNELSFKAYMRTLKQFNSSNNANHIMRAIVYSSIRDLCGGENGKHRIVTFSMVYSLLKKDRDILDVIGRYVDTETLDHKIAVAILEMGVDESLMIFKKDHMIKERMQELIKSSEDVCRKSLEGYNIQLESCYYEDAMIIYSVLKVYDRFLMASKEKKFSEKFKNFKPDESTCSEQMEAFCRLFKHPIVNLSGTGGSGKTSFLSQLAKLFKFNEILYGSFMGAHVNNLKKPLVKNLVKIYGPNGANLCRIGTIHSMVQKHSVLCSRVFPFLVEHNGEKRAKAMRSGALEKIAALASNRNPDDPNHRTCIQDALYNYPFTKCFIEDCKIFVIEEASVMYHPLGAMALWMFANCCEEGYWIVTAGDLKQLPPIQAGHFQEDFLHGLSKFTIPFNHMHRFDNRILGENAHAIASKNPNAFRIDEECVKFIEITPDNYLTVVEKFLERSSYTIHNIQFVARTNEICYAVANKILEKLVLPAGTKPIPNKFYRYEPVTPKITLPGMVTNSLLEVVCSLMVCINFTMLPEHDVPDMNEKMNEQVDEMHRLEEIRKMGFSEEQAVQIGLESDVSLDFEIIDENCHRQLYDMFENIVTGKRLLHTYKPRKNGRLENIIIPLSNRVKEIIIKHMRLQPPDGCTIEASLLSVNEDTTQEPMTEDCIQLLVLKDKIYTANDTIKPEPPSELHFVPAVRSCLEHLKNACCISGYASQGIQVPNLVFVEPRITMYSTRFLLYVISTRSVNEITYMMPDESSIAKMIRTDEPARKGILQQCLNTLSNCYYDLFEKDVFSSECNVAMEILEQDMYGLKTKENTLEFRYERANWQNEDCLDTIHMKKILLRRLAKLKKKGLTFNQAKWKVICDILGADSEGHIPWTPVNKELPKENNSIQVSSNEVFNCLEKEIENYQPNKTPKQLSNVDIAEAHAANPIDNDLDDGKFVWKMNG